jgi:hypothetical protein
VLTGLLGFVLAGLCAVWVMLYGGPVPPEGDVAKAVSFDAALGLFVLSTAAISPLSGLSAKSRAWFRRSYIVLALYSYAAETVQNFRGFNPRFTRIGSAFDHGVGFVFAFVALLLVLFYLVFAASFFRRNAYRSRPELTLGIRYAMIGVLLSFAAGIWISVNQGRFVGLHGNIIWLHGLGFHALQTVPFVAWLAERAPLKPSVRRRFIHTAGIASLLGLVAVAGQTFLGLSVLEWSILPVAAGGCLLAALATAVPLLRYAWVAAPGTVDARLRKTYSPR